MNNLGPYELNQIYCGECSEGMSHLPADSIPMWITSPPYDSLRAYKGYTFPFEAIARQLWRITAPGGAGVWVVADETKNGSESGTSFRQALYFMGLGFNLHDTMIYQTPKPPMNDNRYQASFEYMFVFSKGKVRTFNPIMVESTYAGHKTRARYRQENGNLDDRFHEKPIGDTKVKENIWRFTSGHSKSTHDDIAHNHPAIFPEALARDHILSWSNPGDLVFDPMAGSGTVAKMAYLTGRNFLGFEISQEYTDLARRRVELAMSQPALFNPYQPAAKVEPIQMELG
jgi:DNA modification methylase